MILEVKVKPKSSQEKIVPVKEGPWVVYLREAPEKGKANDALRRILSEQFQVARSRIHILQGETSKYKRVQIEVS